MDLIINEGRFLKAGFFILICFGVFPFLAAALFIHPQVDDYVFAEITRHYGPEAAQGLFYKFWLGRWFSTLLLTVVNPLLWHSLFLYRFLPFLFSGLLGASLFFLLKELVPMLSRSSAILIAGGFVLIYFNGMNSTAEGIYWMAGTYTYSFSLPFLLMYMLVIFRLAVRKPAKPDSRPSVAKYITPSLLITILVGFNEVTMCVSIFFTVLIIFYHLIRKKKIPPGLWMVIAFGFITAILMIRSPGNQFRMQMSADQMSRGHGDLKYAVFQSVYSSVKLSLQWLGTVLPLTIILSLICRKEWQKPFFLFAQGIFIHPMAAWLIALLFIDAALFPGYWAMGTILPGRALNIIYFHFLISVVYASFCTISRYRKQLSLIRFPEFGRLLLMILCTGLILGGSQNLKTAFADLIFSRFKQYDREERSRKQLLIECTDPVCQVEPLRVKPRTIFYADFFGDPYNIFNFCYASYWEKPGIAVKGAPAIPRSLAFDTLLWKIHTAENR